MSKLYEIKLTPDLMQFIREVEAQMLENTAAKVEQAAKAKKAKV